MILVMSLVEPIGDSTEAGAPQSMSGLAGEDFGKTGATLETWVPQLVPSQGIRSQLEEAAVPDEL